MDVARVAEPGCRTRCHPRRHAACVALQPGRDHHCRGNGSVTATCPVDDVHQAWANVGVTEDRGHVVWRIKQELK